ncbi:MAG: cyanophycinase [Pirellulaceae bacterium]|nr:cyanophycinase [Pirellulaceae bacterium]
MAQVTGSQVTGSQGAELQRNGHLVIIGGGLRPSNVHVFEKIIEYAGGVGDARFVVLPTASLLTQDAEDFCKYLTRYGVHSDRSEVLNVNVKNAATATHDEAILQKIRRATGVYLAGGDQRRLVKLLTKEDGSDTPLLAEIRNVYERGGVIAGSSAGASAQSATMLAVSGLHDKLIDEGLDTLDYGITSHSDQRGLLLTRGFGFFKAGIIDQHFTQYRGRLGRLTRATADSGVSLGFGIDENTALLISRNGPIQVAGMGTVIVIKPSSRGQDGPLGYKISNVTLSMLSDGDTFDPVTGEYTIAKEKPLLVTEKLEYEGNFLLNDLGGGGAVTFAMVSGLAENTRTVQTGVSVKYHGESMHGYRFVIRKRPTTKAYGGEMNDQWTYSLLDVQLDVSPIAGGLKPAETQVPRDLPSDETQAALTAVAFRGLLTANSDRKFRPDAAITRLEFASALARSVHLPSPMPSSISIHDLEPNTLEHEEVLEVVNARMMQVDTTGNFHPDKPLASMDAAAGLRKLIEYGAPLEDGKIDAVLAKLDAAKDRKVPRATIGVLLHSILKLPE